MDQERTCKLVAGLFSAMTPAKGCGDHEVDLSLVCRQNIKRGHNTDIWSHYRLSPNSLAVAGHGHVAQDVDEGDMRSKMVDHSYEGFCHTFHELLARYITLLWVIRRRVDHGFADAAIRTTYTFILVRSYESASRMSLKIY